DYLQTRLTLQDGTEPFEHVEKIGCKTAFRIALFLQGQDRHGQFGQVLQRQIIELAALCKRYGRIKIVAPKAATVADAHALQVTSLRFAGGRITACKLLRISWSAQPQSRKKITKAAKGRVPAHDFVSCLAIRPVILPS